jgi:hypothetical protein
MESAERENLRAQLEAGRAALAGAISGLSEQDAARRPAEGKWSVLDCVEHLAIVEEYLLSQVESASPGTEMVNPAREEKIRRRAPDRSFAVQSPEMALPRGRFATLAEAMDRFLKARARTLCFLDDCSSDLRSQFTTHPLIGKANCQEMFLMIAMHPLRHSQQIAEIRAMLG